MRRSRRLLRALMTLMAGVICVLIITIVVAAQNAAAGSRVLEVAAGRQSKQTGIVTGTLVYLPSLYLDPTPTPTEPPVPPDPAWLVYANQFRALANVVPLNENESWSNGGYLHGRYMVKNDYVGHDEDPDNPWYTPEGQAAAQSGNVFVSSYLGTGDLIPIDFWMTAPFHAVGIIDPQLYATGYGIYRENIGLWKAGATMDVVRGLGALPPSTSFPIVFPGQDSTYWLDHYYGGEFPDPLTSCPGYQEPSGPPLIVQIGSGNLTPQVLSHTFSSGGDILESCRYDETDYFNPDPTWQDVGRLVLNVRDAIVIMPREPLNASTQYSVQIILADQTISWQFSTGSSAYALPFPMPGGAEIR